MGTKWIKEIFPENLYDILEDLMQEIEERKNTSDKIKLMQGIGRVMCGDCWEDTCGDEPTECNAVKEAIRLHDQYLIKMCEEE